MTEGVFTLKDSALMKRMAEVIERHPTSEDGSVMADAYDRIDALYDLLLRALPLVGDDMAKEIRETILVPRPVGEIERESKE